MCRTTKAAQPTGSVHAQLFFILTEDILAILNVASRRSAVEEEYEYERQAQHTTANSVSNQTVVAEHCSNSLV